MRFESPLAFLLLLVLPLLLWVCRRRGAPAIAFSGLGELRAAGVSWRIRLGWLPQALRFLAMILVVVVLARPQQGMERVQESREGIAIEMVLDRSGSMSAEMQFGAERLNRLEVVKRVFADFVEGDGAELKGRPNDLIGMIAFARYYDTVSPLTLAHGALTQFLKTVELAKGPREHIESIQQSGGTLLERASYDRRRDGVHVRWRDKRGQIRQRFIPNEDGTNMGDALALAAARLKEAEGTFTRGEANQDYTIQSKVIILLTDGRNNRGKRKPLDAARLAKEWGIKVYTIGVGGGEGQGRTFFGMPVGRSQNGVNREMLTQIAELTGGKFFMAENASSLRDIYREIDGLERTEIVADRYMDYREVFAPFLLAAVCALALEIVFINTLFRRLP